ncbi:hypothetical protein PRIPAC_72311 [Pristionchus pacificus]|uniref:Uncharacterized protein n=1 Tax=Pristionchus pacificus TaxID=54126 RepID=A0A2A6CSW1_PRIPA|nr:hypothetical protein PRIPAC_72311 [Pristionchus pacificus]|eukprot:PDM81229.1 hypothetical protein PRIPAC_36232 [Pristionchus pacificus]
MLFIPGVTMSDSRADATLVANIDKMSLNPPAASPKKPTRTWNPAEFLALQSAKSSGLAGKYRTGKFSRDPANVLKDLHANASITPDEKIVTKSRGVIVEKIFISDDSSESEEEEQLIPRGLWRGKVSKKNKKSEDKLRTGKALIEYASYSVTGQGYECGVGQWDDLHSPSQIPSNVTASVGAKMTGIINTPQSTSTNSPRSNGFAISIHFTVKLNCVQLSKSDQFRLFLSSPDTKIEDEIPDSLVDFILQYTREVGSDAF